MAMVRLAVAGTPGWEVWDLEFAREGPSYTFDTLTTLAAEGLTALQIFFIIGADAFAEIATWHRYPEVLDRAHFVAVARPGTSLELLQARLPQLADRMCRPADVATSVRPRIVLLETDTPDVSATEVRRRLARGESIGRLVPSAVAAYIDQNLLYRPESGVPTA
jgi:nicotinate-nucleotide adenylyltransferase